MTQNKGIDRGVPLNNVELKHLKDNGYTFVCRYLSKATWKRLTKQEALLISKNELFVVVVYQDFNNHVSRFTREIGITQANEAIRQAKAIGIPKDKPIYFAVDYDAISTSDFNAIYNYFRGVISVVSMSDYEVGVYGSYNTIVHVTKMFKDIIYTWQTYAWSKKKIYENYSLYQYHNDTNIIADDKRTVLVQSVDLNYSNGAAGGWKIRS